MGPVSIFNQRFLPSVSLNRGIVAVGRLAVRRRRVLPLHHVPDRLPLQAAQGQLHDQDLPPEHQRERLDLSRHLEGPVESSIDYLDR